MGVLYFGGSFNPIHHAHLICARAAAEARGFKNVVLVPSAQPPHKPELAELASGTDRLEMCRLAAAESQSFEVSDVELKLPSPSYTIQTVKELKRRGAGTIHWLIGADMLLDLPKWRHPLELLTEVQFIVMARPGWTLVWDRLPPEYQALKNHVVEAPQIDIRASEIRRRVKTGLPIEYLTPAPVCAYIRSHGLYR